MDIKPKQFKVDYETTFIVTPDVSESDYKDIVAKFTNLVKEAEGEVTNLEYWGFRKLAYPIAAKFNGYYAFFEFNCFGTLIEKLEREFRYDERILRFLTVKLDKDSLAFNKKRREQGFGKRQKSEANPA